MNNYMTLKFKSVSENEALARMAVSAFVGPLNPSLEELADIKTSISEAVSNCVIHGYEDSNGTVEITAIIEGDEISIRITDDGRGIPDVEKAREPLFTTKPELERSGMGFTIMESFMDSIDVISSVHNGTTVIMSKTIKAKANECPV
ncbi:MAG: anti-sigma F factor [Eubacteriaceae bacterium]|jgi:stage II sporulation protein AB (anti-sigma F factor)|nr:anti-sigma F factor [Eubacteriaceae bacterium]